MVGGTPIGACGPGKQVTAYVPFCWFKSVTQVPLFAVQLWPLESRQELAISSCVAVALARYSRKFAVVVLSRNNSMGIAVSQSGRILKPITCREVWS